MTTDDETLIRRTYVRFAEYLGNLDDDEKAMKWAQNSLVARLHADINEKGFRIEVPAIVTSARSYDETPRTMLYAEAIVLMTPRQDIEQKLIETKAHMTHFAWWRVKNWRQRRWIWRNDQQTIRALQQILSEMDQTGAK